MKNLNILFAICVLVFCVNHVFGDESVPENSYYNFGDPQAPKAPVAGSGAFETSMTEAADWGSTEIVSS